MIAILLEDAVESDDSDEEDEIDLAWEAGEVLVDARLSRPEEAFRGHTQLHLANKENMSPTRCFLHFLPMNDIRQVVIPAINAHALMVVSRWQELTYEEYFIWIALFTIMTAVNVQDRAAYWHRSPFLFSLALDFGQYMTYERFEQLLQMHVFVMPDPVR